MADKFKISTYGVGQWQKLKMLFDQPKESDQYPGTYSMLVEHEGTQKYWNFSRYIVNRLNELQAKKGTVLNVCRQEGEGGKTFCQVEVDGDITTAPQNNPNTPPLPTPPPDMKDNTQDRIIRGMCWNAASRVSQSKTDILPTAKELYTQSKAWLAGEEEQPSEVPLPEYKEDTISVDDLPF